VFSLGFNKMEMKNIGQKTYILSRAIDCWCEHRGGGKEEID